MQGDTAFGEHHKHFPHCDFLKQTMTKVYDEDVQQPPEIENKIVQLLNELEITKKNVICQTCEHAKISILFLPCRHLVCCEECAARIKHCPVCGEFIEGTVKTLNWNNCGVKDTGAGKN